MEVLTAIIENYAKAHGISAYTLRHYTVTKEQLSQRIQCAPGAAFFYKFECDGIISEDADISKPLCTIKTNDDYLDLSAVVMHKDDGTIQRGEANFILQCDNTATIKLTEPGDGIESQFSEIYNACLHYVQLTPSEGTSNGGRERYVKVSL